MFLRIWENYSYILFYFILYLCAYRFFWEVLVRLCPIMQESSEVSMEPQFNQKLKPDPRIIGAGDPGGYGPVESLDENNSEMKVRLVRPPVMKYQNYKELIKECTEKKIVFKDPEFPATMSSIFYKEVTRISKEKKFQENLRKPVNWEWLRPSQINSNPQFYIRDDPEPSITRWLFTFIKRNVPRTKLNISPPHMNVVQGGLYNCWLVAALSVISMYPELLRRVAPPQEEFKYGIFYFNFWSFGKWIDIVVDDRLPCVNRRPFSIHSKIDNQFLYALLEKAYAKMHGSYESLESGFAGDAFVDLTGGIVEFYKLKRENIMPLFTDLIESFQMQSLIACLTKPDPETVERKLPTGLITGHAYSITNVCEILVEKTEEDGAINRYTELMIRLRNPWGNVEWNGPWSDGSEEWQWVSEETKKEIGLANQDDGEFWMTFQDFAANFFSFEIVHLTRYVHVLPSKKVPWDFAMFHGEWVLGVTNGGGKNMAMNPQYRITLTQPDKLIKDGKCILCVALTQKYKRIMKKSGSKLFAIGFCIYHLTVQYRNVAPTPAKFFSGSRQPVATRKSEFIREVSARIRVPPGSYLIIPFAYYGEEGQFLLRVFTSGHAKIGENDPPLNSPTLPKELDHKDAIDIEVKRYIDLFQRIHKPEIGLISLKKIMNHFGSTIPHFKGFNKETVRSAIVMVDEDQDGKIDYREFILLFQFLEPLRRTFIKEDKSKTGILPPFRFKDVMSEAGYDLPQAALNKLCLRYSQEDGSFRFDDLVLCVIKTHVLSETFKFNQTNDGFVEFNFQDWFIATIFT